MDDSIGAEQFRRVQGMPTLELEGIPKSLERLDNLVVNLSPGSAMAMELKTIRDEIASLQTDGKILPAQYQGWQEQLDHLLASHRGEIRAANALATEKLRKTVVASLPPMEEFLKN